MSTDSESARARKTPGQSRWILWALALGLVCGVFFGEYCRPLRIVGDGFVKLLQITVMPYITVSLILGIGGLTGAQARELARKAGTLMLLFWAIALLTVALVPLSFPHWQSAAFFSTSLVEQPRPQNFLDLYIPSNPFRSLAESVVPAVVLFSILVGIALMGVKEKTGLLRGLAIATETLSRVTNLIVRLTPVGLFTAEAGSAWTLLYPRFAVVVPQPELRSIPLTYAVPRGEQELVDYVDAWIELNQKDGTTARLYDYWILGRGAVEQRPRWSVLRNVLHWVR